MKFNKWTLSLAAVGIVSLNSAVKAEEAPQSVWTAVSSTTLSGYVDTSMQWNFGTGNEHTPPYSFGGAGKADGFNLNVVQLSLDKPLNEAEWASGYHVDLWMGPDANALGSVSSGSSSDFAIRQAYVALRMPVGNGIDWKIGVFDTVIGYESLASPNNPNYTRSYGFTVEPTTHTGVLATYRINDMVSLSGGVANTFGSMINGRANPPQAESYKTYMGSFAITAPEQWGFLSGSTFSGGVINGFNASADGTSQTSWYAGATLSTPVTGLKLGATFDYVDHHGPGSKDNDEVASNSGNTFVVGLYTSYQATEKLSLHLRGEYMHDKADLFEEDDFGANGFGAKVYEVTATAQYDLWKNVISRVEFRWDHSNDKFFGSNSNSSFGDPTRKNAFMLAANVIYKF
ncbi:MAG: hypothetical protein QOD03_969 [Verrucomicrobiota bacterium]